MVRRGAIKMKIYNTPTLILVGLTISLAAYYFFLHSICYDYLSLSDILSKDHSTFIDSEDSNKVPLTNNSQTANATRLSHKDRLEELGLYAINLRLQKIQKEFECIFDNSKLPDTVHTVERPVKHADVPQYTSPESGISYTSKSAKKSTFVRSRCVIQDSSKHHSAVALNYDADKKTEYVNDFRNVDMTILASLLFGRHKQFTNSTGEMVQELGLYVENAENDHNLKSPGDQGKAKKSSLCNEIETETGLMFAGGLIALVPILLLIQTHRTVVMAILSIVAVFVLEYLNMNPNYADMIQSSDADYIMRVYMMMLLISVTSDSGLFDAIAVKCVKIAGGNFLVSLAILSVATFTASLVLDNILAVLIMTPVVIRACEELRVDPRPVLRTICIYSNLAALHHASYPYKQVWVHWHKTNNASPDQSYFSEMLPGAIICHVITIVYLSWQFLCKQPHRYESPYEVEMQHEQLLWDRLVDSMSIDTSCAMRVQKEMMAIRDEVEREYRKKMNRPHDNDSIGLELEEDRKIRDFSLLFKVFLTVTLIIVLKVLVEYDLLDVNDSWIAMVCSGVLLVLVNPSNLNDIFCRMDWSTMISLFGFIFFGKVLVMLQLDNTISNYLTSTFANDMSGTALYGQNVKDLILVVLLVSALLSALISNVSTWTVFGNMVTILSDSFDGWTCQRIMCALSFGGNLGGIIAALGSGSAIAYLTSAAQQGYQDSLKNYFSFSAPLGVLCLAGLALYNNFVI